MKKNYLYSILATLFLAVVAFMFFFPDDLQGNVLQQHDIMQGIANGQEAKAFHEATGETTRWTDSLFGGMPTFQIAPSYPAGKALDWIAGLYRLWLPSPAGLLFSMMFGFFIMCLCLKMKWPTALFAAVGWGLSTYFIIIIGAGHIWKFLTLSYIPPTIGGLALCYRGRYASGTAMAALFGALQLQSNHPQMSYYFGMVIVCLLLAWLWMAVREHKVKQWAVATLCCIGAGVLALGANSASLYNSYEYSKETVRGHATDLRGSAPAGTPAEGMDREAITSWSYGLDETLTLLIPNVKGGATLKPVAGQNRILSSADTDKAAEAYISPEEMQVVGQFPQYFGDQPMTNGPVYVGAFVLMLAILGMFVVRGEWESPLKWALFASAILSIALAWGHNFPLLTDFMIDYFPGYNKFRAPASALVVAEFCIPLIAALCVRTIILTPGFFAANKWTVIGVMGAGAAVCLLGWLFPSMFGQPYSQMEIEQLTAQGVMQDPAYAGVFRTVAESRLSLVSSDSLRSLAFIVAGCLLLWMYDKGMMGKPVVFVLSLTAVVLLDLFSVNKRFVSSESFTEPVSNEAALEMTPADEAILKDKSHYRVLDIDGFGSARSSYFHKTVGGYHAAKLTRYNDLINEQISKGNQGVLDMLNTKYVLHSGTYDVNPGALGNAWWVDRVDYVATPDEEMRALDTINPGVSAVADSKFRPMLGQAVAKTPGDTIVMTSYAPNRLNYRAKSKRGGVALFSEIYFPWGWKATVDGKPVEIGRADYVLRALRLPAGEHDVEFVFDPESLSTTNTVSVVCVVLIYLLVAGAVASVCVPVLSGKRRKEV
ncbi:MAG: YfhO family protein [Muribaculaceae bacterium]|nr:YfhO family protein [Muribaculaceae bacterium]